MKVALYHRVSTVDQDPTLARDELRAAAKRMGAEVALDVEETGSGVRQDRPGLLRVLKAAQRGQIDTVLVWKLDRFGRSALDLLAQIHELEAAGVGFVCTSQGLHVRPGADAISRLMLTVLSAVAEFERDLIVDRTMAGLARARDRGQKFGRPQLERPDAAEVRRRREAREPWATIADELGTTMYRCQQALREDAVKE